MERVYAADVLHAQVVITRCGCHAQDATRKQISVGDIVDVAAGRAKGKSGTVKYIQRQGLFLHVRWAALPCSVSYLPLMSAYVRPAAVRRTSAIVCQLHATNHVFASEAEAPAYSTRFSAKDYDTAQSSAICADFAFSSPA